MQLIAALILALSPLQEAEVALRSMPECRPIIEQVSRQGGFSLVSKSYTPFEAQWNSDTRAVEIDLNKHRNFGHIITSVLFELHNALTDRELQRLYELARNKTISKDMYVRMIEEIEWKNWQATCKLLELGRERGIFPKEAFLPAFSSFSEYLRLQNEAGHSQYHSESYDLF